MYFRRRETPWEVVDSKQVDPVPTYYDDDDDLEISAINDIDSSRTYIFEVKSVKGKSNSIPTRNAVVFARQQLLDQVFQQGYNMFLYESWRITVYRRAKVHRVEVYYNARAARTLDKVQQRTPPFLSML